MDLVSVIIPTYNVEEYFDNCLQSILNQTYPNIEIVVCDDASTDGEQEVIRSFVNEHFDVDNVNVENRETEYAHITCAPHKSNKNCNIVVLYLKENLYSKKMNYKKMEYLSEWLDNSKYEAICEGDDYWIDPLKLQKQVDFLDANPEYSFCCHRFSIYKQDCKQWLSEYADSFYTDGKNLEITLDLFFKTWITQPLTVVCRMEILKSIEREIMSYKYSRDVHLFYHLLKKGRGISLNDKMGVYRWHDGGVASSLTLVGKYRLAVNIYEELYLHTNDAKILEVYIKNGINLIKYSSWSTETFLLFRKLWSYTNDIKEKFILLSSLITPIPIVKFISTMRTLCSKLTKPFLCK